jgi:hypothetical protein
MNKVWKHAVILCRIWTTNTPTVQSLAIKHLLSNQKGLKFRLFHVDLEGLTARVSRTGRIVAACPCNEYASGKPGLPTLKHDLVL